MEEVSHSGVNAGAPANPPVISVVVVVDGDQGRLRLTHRELLAQLDGPKPFSHLLQAQIDAFLLFLPVVKVENHKVILVPGKLVRRTSSPLGPLYSTGTL